jgi:hypothetical protein
MAIGKFNCAHCGMGIVGHQKDCPKIARLHNYGFDMAVDIKVHSYPTEMDVGIKVTHKPTGTVVIVVSERQQHRNKEKALDGLAAILRDT